MIVFIVWAPLSYGQPPTQLPYDISDSELDQRLKFIETRLVVLNPKASYWQYGWTGFYATTAAGQAVCVANSCSCGFYCLRKDCQEAFTATAKKIHSW
jgi:hypothetical protein